MEKDALEAVKDLVKNPPEPLGDMRRADAHRTTYVGKNMKKQHGDAWADMPATNYYQTVTNSTAQFFRDRISKDSS